MLRYVYNVSGLRFTGVIQSEEWVCSYTRFFYHYLLNIYIDGQVVDGRKR